MFGLDGDGPDIFEDAQFAIDARIDLPRFAIVTPFPGTGLYKRFEMEGGFSIATGNITTDSMWFFSQSG